MSWRHHCRYCGRVFCGSCSAAKRTLPALGFDKPVRVCGGCDALLADAGVGEAGSGSEDGGGDAPPTTTRGPPSGSNDEEEYYSDED
jgi:hypothetical protein